MNNQQWFKFEGGVDTLQETFFLCVFGLPIVLVKTLEWSLLLLVGAVLCAFDAFHRN